MQGSDLRNQTATSRVVVRLLIEPYVVLDIHLNFCYSLKLCSLLVHLNFRYSLKLCSLLVGIITVWFCLYV